MRYLTIDQYINEFGSMPTSEPGKRQGVFVQNTPTSNGGYGAVIKGPESWQSDVAKSDEMWVHANSDTHPHLVKKDLVRIIVR